MKELYGIDMEQSQYSKTFDGIPESDIAISMGRDVGCPYIGRTFDDNWGLNDPTGCQNEVFREIISQINRRIIRLKLPHNISAPAGMIGASNFFELSVAVAVALFGTTSPAALATMVGVLTEVPVMLTLVKIANKTNQSFR